MMKPKSLLIALLLVAATALAYLPAIRDGGFIWDDDHYVHENRLLAEDGGLGRIWFEPQASPQYYPLVFTTFRIEYKIQRWLAGDDGRKNPRPEPFIFHLDNVLLHGLAAVVLWRLLLRLRLPGALLAAAIFALHPVHVESVAWVTERKNVLSGLFYLLALAAYLRFDDLASERTGARRHYVLALVFFVLALFSKTVTSTLGPVILVLAWWRRGRFGWREVRRVAPFFVLGLLGAAMTTWTELNHVEAKGPEWDLSLAERVLVAGRAVAFYAGKLIWPDPLIFSYERWVLDASSLAQWLFPIAVLGLMGALVALGARGRMPRGPAAALLFFVGTLFPALGFINVYPFRYSFVADHFQYLASLGLIVPAAALLARIRPKVAFAAVGVAILVALSVVTWRQCRIYEGLESLWLDTIAKNPQSWMAYNNLGDVYLDRKEKERAIAMFRKAAELGPGAREVLNNVGLFEGTSGNYEEALRWFDRAIELDPRHHPSLANKALVLMYQNRLDEALACVDRSIAVAGERDIDYNHANLIRGQILRRLSRTDDALAAIDHFLRKDWRNPIAHTERGLVMRALGREDEAARCFENALQIDPGFVNARIEMGRQAMDRRDFAAAAMQLVRALAGLPDNAEVAAGAREAALAATASLPADRAARTLFDLTRNVGPKAGPRFYAALLEGLRRQGRTAQFNAALRLAREESPLKEDAAMQELLRNFRPL